ICLRRACATGLRTKATSRMPAKRKSPTYCPRPRRNRSSSLRRTESPIPYFTMGAVALITLTSGGRLKLSHLPLRCLVVRLVPQWENAVPYRDMRDYLATLEQHGLLRRVAREVDRDWEVACLAKWIYQALPVERRFGLLFENVKGSDIPIVTAALGASPHSVALALQCDVEEINDKVVAALRAPIKPKTVGASVCQENVLLGEMASLTALPIVTWTPGKDKAPYITTNVVTRDHGTGIQNMGVYRTMLRDEHSVVVNL